MHNGGYFFSLSSFSFSIPFAGLDLELGPPLPLLLGAGSVVLYAVLLFIVWPAALANSNQKVVEKWAKLHHAALCFYSVFCLLATLLDVWKNGELENLDLFFCQPVSPFIRLLSLSFTLSKIWEWGDTMVLIARGDSLQKIGTLHSYHHATTFCLFLLVCNFPATEKCGLLLNGGVHALMYYHYAFRLPKW